MADDGTRPLAVHFEYQFDRLLSAKLAQVYARLVPDQRWPVTGVTPAGKESGHEHARRDLRARVVRSSA